jgi:hypothetical protein
MPITQDIPIIMWPKAFGDPGTQNRTDHTKPTDGLPLLLPLSNFVYTHGLDNNTLSLNYPDGCGSLSIFLWEVHPFHQPKFLFALIICELLIYNIIQES